MAILDDIVLTVAVIAIILVAVTVLELRYLRRVMRRRRERLLEGQELPDRAHNAILTTRAIYGALQRDGMTSAQVEGLIGEARMAFSGRNYRTAIDLTERAKGVMKAEKLRHQRMGDAAKLDRSSPGEEEPTTKEVLQKELPPNYAQSKFSISLAVDRIRAAEEEGRDVTEASRFLETARARFDVEDFTAALAHAILSRKAADGEPTEAEEPPEPGPTVRTAERAIPPPTARTCTSCGAELLRDDTFCRKCGVKVEPAADCPQCGAPRAEGGAFCRRCGHAMG